MFLCQSLLHPIQLVIKHLLLRLLDFHRLIDYFIQFFNVTLYFKNSFAQSFIVLSKLCKQIHQTIRQSLHLHCIFHLSSVKRVYLAIKLSNSAQLSSQDINFLFQVCKPLVRISNCLEGTINSSLQSNEFVRYGSIDFLLK